MEIAHPRENIMKLKIILVMFLFFSPLSVLSLQSIFSSEKHSSNKILNSGENVIKNLSVNWTIMMYLDGDNDLEVTAVDILKQCERGIGTSESIKILALVDRIEKYNGLDGNWEDTRLYLVKADKISSIDSELLDSQGEKDMGNGSTLEFFLTYCIENYPSENYLLNLYDHGDGVFGICDDFTDNNMLTIEEIQKAIKNSLLKTGENKIDIVCFSACNMATIEIAYELRDIASYYVASEGPTFIGNLDWENVLYRMQIHSLSPEGLVFEMVESCELRWLTNEEHQFTFSAIDLNQISNLTLIGDLGIFLSKCLVKWNLTACLIELRKFTQGFDKIKFKPNPDFVNENNYYNTIYIDLLDFVKILKDNSSIVSPFPTLLFTLSDLEEQLESAILSNFQHHTYSNHANGLMIFFPYHNYNLMQQIVQEYYKGSLRCKNLDFISNCCWNDFIECFFTTDNDSDLLVDWFEVEHNLNPGKNETLINGILDGNLDLDGDLLVNIDEFYNGCDPWKNDTDFDFLSDTQEINVYGTVPFLYDTDEDGFSDGVEIEEETDPLDPEDFPAPSRLLEIILLSILVIIGLILIPIIFRSKKRN